MRRPTRCAERFAKPAATRWSRVSIRSAATWRFRRTNAGLRSSRSFPTATHVRARSPAGSTRNSATRIVGFAAIESVLESAAPAGRFRRTGGAFPDDGRPIHGGRCLGPNVGPSHARADSIDRAADDCGPTGRRTAKNADDHTVPAPTATGPIETQPESGARVGRAEGDDFASQNNSAAGPVPPVHPIGLAATLFDLLRQPSTASTRRGLKSSCVRRRLGSRRRG